MIAPKLTARARQLAAQAHSPNLPAAEVVLLINSTPENEQQGNPVFAFDPQSPGWTPQWWPTHASGQPMTPAQRAAWFLEALRENYAPPLTLTEPSRPLAQRIRRSIQSLYDHTRMHEDYPTPDWLPNQETSPLSPHLNSPTNPTSPSSAPTSSVA